MFHPAPPWGPVASISLPFRKPDFAHRSIPSSAVKLIGLSVGFRAVSLSLYAGHSNCRLMHPQPTLSQKWLSKNHSLCANSPIMSHSACRPCCVSRLRRPGSTDLWRISWQLCRYLATHHFSCSPLLLTSASSPLSYRSCLQACLLNSHLAEDI